MTDFRALCAELADELQGYKIAHPMHCRALLIRARAAEAQSDPLSLKEQALNDLDTIQTHDSFGFQIIDLSNIRRALEALDD